MGHLGIAAQTALSVLTRALTGMSVPLMSQSMPRNVLHSQAKGTTMKILIAEDDPISRRMLEATLRKWNHEVVVTSDGRAALAALQGKDAPPLVILDWMMPEMDGPEVCRRLRARPGGDVHYVILLTAKGTKQDIVVGLHAGADDYLTKPFDHHELHARLLVGQRILTLQAKLTDRVAELELALARVKQLQKMLPICSYCKKVRNDRNYWQDVEFYIAEHSEARFSHGICPECMDTVVKNELAAFNAEQAAAETR